MATETLTAERILEAAEEVLRRYGPAKANVVDVARALGVSHGSVYRHFPSKAAEISEPLDVVAAGRRTAPERLERWLDLLVQAKHQRALDDPELFATYMELAAEAREVVRAHVETLVGQLARVIEDGVAQGDFRAEDPRAAGRAVFDATSRFHNPAHAAEWTDPQIAAAYEDVRSLVLRGLLA
jgi:AcrR family transcriptional regulator